MTHNEPITSWVRFRPKIVSERHDLRLCQNLAQCHESVASAEFATSGVHTHVECVDTFSTRVSQSFAHSGVYAGLPCCLRGVSGSSSGR